VGIQFDTSFLALEAARQGQGVALGRWPMIAHDLLSNRLKRPFTTALAIDEGYFIVWPKVKALNPKAVLLSDWLLEEAAAEPLPDRLTLLR
jgi:LysR family glycine cleavage system transcriptional activator